MTRKTKAENDADTITRASREFLLAHALGEKQPAVPDSVWHGNDCWILNHGGRGWVISERGRKAMAVLSARACASGSGKSPSDGKATGSAGGA